MLNFNLNFIVALRNIENNFKLHKMNTNKNNTRIITLRSK